MPSLAPAHPVSSNTAEGTTQVTGRGALTGRPAGTARAKPIRSSCWRTIFDSARRSEIEKPTSRIISAVPIGSGSGRDGVVLGGEKVICRGSSWTVPPRRSIRSLTEAAPCAASHPSSRSPLIRSGCLNAAFRWPRKRVRRSVSSAVALVGRLPSAATISASIRPASTTPPVTAVIRPLGGMVRAMMAPRQKASIRIVLSPSPESTNWASNLSPVPDRAHEPSRAATRGTDSPSWRSSKAALNGPWIGIASVS